MLVQFGRRRATCGFNDKVAGKAGGHEFVADAYEQRAQIIVPDIPAFAQSTAIEVGRRSGQPLKIERAE